MQVKSQHHVHDKLQEPACHCHMVINELPVVQMCEGERECVW